MHFISFVPNFSFSGHLFISGQTRDLRQGDASITLEPGGQLELSSAPLATIHQTCAEFRGHMAELRDISDELSIAWLGVGFHPFARQQDLPWVPKLRYSVMREYLPTKGGRGLDMMRRTTTVQANLDFSSEPDAVAKLRAGLAISPFLTAIFANSPFYEGALGDHRSERATVWMDMDPDRTGLLPFVWEDGFGYQQYVDWALDVPMFMVKRGQNIVHNTGQPFREFMRDGFEGTVATTEDWTTHINTLFPEVRLKNILEFRSVDGQPNPMVCALPALLKGLLYDAQALRALEGLVSKMDLRALESLRPKVATDALRAQFGGRSVGEWAGEILEIAESGLKRLSHLNRQGQDETIHLVKLRALLEQERCPADELLEGLDHEADLVPQIIARTRL